MSKHTNKVHGKLNFLMIAVVVVLGAVSYLMVQSGLVDPSQGTSSGIKGVKKADKYVSKNDVVVELDGEEIQDVLNNPDFQKMITSGEFSKLASDPDFVKVLDNKDGIGILGDIYRSLEFNNGGGIDKGGNLGDDAIQSRGNMSGNRGNLSSNRSMNNSNSEETYVVGQRGNPANNDSGINGEGGTGGNARILDSKTEVRGKTGTAQNPHGEDHSWFSGYITAENSSKMSIVAMVEHGGRGSGPASLIAQDIFSYFSSINKD